MKTVILFERSSCLSKGTYDGNSRELDLVFRSNERKHYVFGDVAPAVVGTMVGSDSPGGQFHNYFGKGDEVRTYEEVS